MVPAGGRREAGQESAIPPIEEVLRRWPGSTQARKCCAFSIIKDRQNQVRAKIKEREGLLVVIRQSFPCAILPQRAGNRSIKEGFQLFRGRD